MSYMGGKGHNAEHILQVLNDPLFDGMKYVEPFVGYGHVLRRVVRKSSYAASDSNALLMVLLKAVQRGVRVPNISAREYETLKHQSAITLKRATAAFTYSYNGKEWGGYTARYKGCASTPVRHPPEERRRYYAKLHDNDAFSRTVLSKASFEEVKPFHSLVYCDPPYAGTTAYSDPFDHDLFWDTVRKWSHDNIVFVSEYAAPPDFECVAFHAKSMSFQGANAKDARVERLFMHPRCWTHIRAREATLE